MPESNIPYLCGGIFFDLLQQAQLSREKVHDKHDGGTDGMSDVDMMKKLIYVVTGQPHDPYEATFQKTVSQYKSCQSNGGVYIPITNVATISSFDDSIKNKNSDALKRMSEFVDDFIEAEKAKWLVSALLEIIDHDDGIKLTDVFYAFPDKTSTKKELLKAESFELQPFLLGVLHYIVVNRKKNKLGRATFESMHKKAGKNREWIFDSDIGKLGMENIHVEVLANNENIGNDFQLYLSKAYDKYSKIKTLLYTEQPRPFYDFYVCNDIIQIIHISRREYKQKRYCNATAQMLSDCSNFIIISGNGGLGKSMMLRHFMLQSIEHYKEFGKLPIFIPLKEYDENANNLLTYVYERFTSLDGRLKLPEFEKLLLSGKIILLFDGLDEISTNHMQKFERALDAFADRYVDNMFIISSRPFASSNSFVALNRSTVLHLQSFNKDKALELIDKLDFRADEPNIKNNFRKELDNRLYYTHMGFTENPLLLTIMLMTYEQFAEIPSKMHVFYHEAYVALSQKHDAGKGGYKRVLHTGLTADIFAEYFAEFCAQTYNDDKFDITDIEFKHYFDRLNIHKKYGKKISSDDFLHDLTIGMCLMYYESGKYHFIHRSFQEYFCAVFFAKQKDRNLYVISQRVFEDKHYKSSRDSTFNMLYDMIPEKMEEYVFVPYLEGLFAECDRQNKYWTFLAKLYPYINYDYGDVADSSSNDPKSFIYDFIVKINKLHEEVDDEILPFDDEFISEKYVNITGNWDNPEYKEDWEDELVNENEVESDYIFEYGDPDVVGWNLSIDSAFVADDPDTYEELLKILDDDDFALKKEYIAVRSYLQKLKAGLTPKGDDLFDLL